MPHGKVIGARQLTKPVPDDCSDRYASGWAYGDWFISKGGDLHADAPGDWHEEKAVGFWDRLSAEQEAQVHPGDYLDRLNDELDAKAEPIPKELIDRMKVIRSKAERNRQRRAID